MKDTRVGKSGEGRKDVPPERGQMRAGDWIKVEPLQCHFACWLDRDSLGVVIKAARAGELGDVGCLGASGKTTCTVPWPQLFTLNF